MLSWFSRSSKDQTERLLDKHLRPDRSGAESFAVRLLTSGPAARSHLDHTARELGVTFPPGIVAHLSGSMPGLSVEVIEDYWPRPSPGAILPAWEFWYGLHTYHCDDEGDEDTDMRPEAARITATLGQPVAPVLRVHLSPERYIVNSSGEMLKWFPDSNEVERQKQDFWGILEAELVDLVDRRDRILAKRHRQ